MTTLLLVRHAIAEERELAAAAGIPDAQRPLTAKGSKKMERIAAALAQQVPELAFIATSPLRRAAQTAALLSVAYKGVKVIETDALTPGVPPEAIPHFIAQRRPQTAVALVGHEPDLGAWASWALCGEERSFMPLKKAGAALITFPDLPVAGHGELVWLLTPSQLRDLA